MTETSSLPFSSIKPLKFIGINQAHPFCFILSESKLIYMSGTHLIIENTKTNQQKIIWNNTFTGPIHLIEHHITLYNDHMLAIAIRDLKSFMNVVVVLPLNHIENSKERCRVHYLRHIQQYQSIKQIHFYEEGSLFAIVSQYQHISTVSLCRTLTGDVLYKQSFCSIAIKLSSISINKLNCLSLLQHDNKGEIRLCLIIIQNITRKYYYKIALKKGETILSHYYETFQQESIMMALTSTGFIIIFKINQFQLIQLTRVDVRIAINIPTIKKSKRESTDATCQSIVYNLPTIIQAASHKLILGYQQPVHIAILSFSAFNPKITKFLVVDSALDNYPHIKGIKDMKACKDNCSLVVTFKIDPLKDKALTLIHEEDLFDMENPNSTTAQAQHQREETNIPIEQPQMQFCDSDQYIVMQIDILSNTIDHEQYALSVQQTFTVCSGHSLVESVKYCAYNNTMFILMHNKILLYYNLSPKQLKNQIAGKTINYTDYKIGGLLMWKHLLSDQPLSIAVHPFNFTLLLIYSDIIKFHSYNTNYLFPAFLVTSLKNCKSAIYSPLGDSIVFATNGAVTIINSYTYQVIKTVLLPNIIGHLLPKRVSKNDITKVTTQTYNKAINKLLFIDNDDLLVFSGSNTFSLIVNHEKAMHFGFIDRQPLQKYQQIVYDPINHLTALTHEDHILVLAKSNINTNNRCEVVSIIQIAATALQICTALAVLFIGGKDGTLYIIKWPDYCASDLNTERSIQYRLFDEPIVNISTSANMNYLFVVSQGGNMCINELVVNNSEQGLSRHLKTVLIKTSQIPLKVNDQWLMSRSEQEKKQREIIKLRGQEADMGNRHNPLNREGEINKEQLFMMKKSQLETEYLQELKQYEDHYGLQRILQEISILRDELKLTIRQRPRVREEIERHNQRQIHDMFESKKQLQLSLLQCKTTIKTQKDKLIMQQQKQIQEIQAEFQLQEQELIEKGEMSLTGWKQKTSNNQIINTNIEQDYNENKEGIQKDFNQDYKTILNSNQTLLSKNRSVNINLHDMQDKMSALNLERQKLEVDLQKIRQEQEELTRTKDTLTLQNQHHKSIQDKLIKNSKELQQQLMLQRKIKERYELNIVQIEQDMEHLHASEILLEDKYKEISNNFILEKEIYAQKCNSLQQFTDKLQELKTIKKQKQYSNLISKNHYQQTLKTIMRNLQVDQDRAIEQLRNEYSVYCEQERGESILLSTEFQTLKKGHDKLAKDAIKWGELKQTYMAGFFRNYGRLNCQKLKLTYQYNDLVKVSQDYKMYINYLQREIDKLKKTFEEQKYLLKPPQSLKPIALTKKGFSFMNTSNDLLKSSEGKKIEVVNHLKKKGICISLHSQNNDRFITEA